MHQSYTKIVSRIAESTWGQDFKDKESAEKALLNDSQKLSAYASIELLRRLQAVCRAVGKEDNYSNSNRVHIDDSAARLPDVSIGQHLFEFSIDEGMTEFVVVAKGEDDTCLMVMLGDYDLEYGPSVRLADSDTKTSKKDAMLHGAMQKLRWEENAVEMARKIRDCVASDLPLTEFEQGICD